MDIRKLTKVSGIAILVVALIMGFMGLPRADATTDQEIENAITHGLTWLAAQQQIIDGSWQYQISPPGPLGNHANTGLALLAFLDRARDLRVDPFQTDPEHPEYFEYAENVILGFDYLFNWILEDGNGIHTLYGMFNGPDVYTTGIIMLAIAASDAPDRPVDTGPLSGLNLTYQDVLQGMLDWMIFAQNKNGCAIGGWNYIAANPDQPQADNSNSGYATLGMGLAAATPPDGFGLQIPESVLDTLDQFIDNIQVQNDEDPYAGGSIYDPCPSIFPWLPPPETWVNILKAGNLLYEIALVGDSITADRVQATLGFIETYWNEQAGTADGAGWQGDYQAMFTLMKGLEAYGIKDLIINGLDTNWFYDNTCNN
jgi:hypothetical protein